MDRQQVTNTNTDNPQPFDALVASLASEMRAQGGLLTTAESCTGGWVAQCITALAGSSEWFDCGFVTYSNAAKIQMLSVPEAILATHGAVSEAVAASMVAGALQHSRAHWALSITGIAGPDGGSAEKPVGTVCFGWGNGAGLLDTQTCCFVGERAEIRRQAVAHALQGLLARLRSTTALA